MRTKYRVGLNDLQWEMAYGKPRKLMCDELLMEFYVHGVICWNENVHKLQPQAIIKRLNKLEARNEERGISKVARKKSRRKKRV